MRQKIATVFGATGFLGRHVVRAFVDAGYSVRAVTRTAQKAYFLKPYGDVGQVVPLSAMMDDPAGVDACVRGADTVVYLPGVLHASKDGFARVHVEYPAQIADAAARFHVRRFIHVSALACERGKSLYARTKRAGEMAVQLAYPNAVILRPSILFGPEDGFFARFAGMARSLPALPLIGGGLTRFQPVFVCDAAKAVLNAATLSPHSHQNPEGRIYELGGPSVYTYKELMQKILAQTGIKTCLVTLPYGLARVMGRVMQVLPGAPLTADQVKSLKTDNIVATGASGLYALGVDATALETVLPSILARFRDGGPAAHKTQAA